MQPTLLEKLYASLQERRRPEDVADWILQLLQDNLNFRERAKLKRVAKGSLRQQLWAFTSMMETFREPVGLQRQVATAQEIFETAAPLSEEDAEDPEKLEPYIQGLGAEINKTFGANNFLKDRLNRAERQARGLDLSNRQYNKRFRHLKRMERKLRTLIREHIKRDLTLTGKHGLAHTLDWDTFTAEIYAACFTAYYTARCNLRSEFTIYGQQRPYDGVAHLLYQRAIRTAAPNWWGLAHSYPHTEVLHGLTDHEKGLLLGRWFGLLEQAGNLLEQVWTASEINRTTMIVRRGNDSSTWNQTASAWNTARDNWIALLHTMGMTEMLEAFCPGKVMRLIAADVAAWHRSAGHKPSPDLHVWNLLPLPWQVLQGTRTCTRSMIEEACAQVDLDPMKSGWVGPRPKGKIAAYMPTPELVHGVSVSSPVLATVLRKQGYFSGKAKQTPPAAPWLHQSVLEKHHERLQNDDPGASIEAPPE